MSNTYVPCKHLDHDEATYGASCVLQSIKGTNVKYWQRKTLPYPEAPQNVQFCGLGRGRINSIFQCYNPGEMSCYEPSTGPATEQAK